MAEQNKITLKQANAAISNGDYEGFLSYCSEDTQWIFVGEQVLNGKEAVRRYMTEAYLDPPKFEAEQFIAEGDYVTAVGKISMKGKDGKMRSYSYCDVWQFRDGKMHQLKAFVIAAEQKGVHGEGKEKSVIGSGFTYDEAKHASDESEPINQVDDEDVVELPDLGKPNRP